MEFLDVAGRTWEELALDGKLVHMGHNCNQLGIDPGIDEAMLEAIRRREYRNYAPPYGFAELRALMKDDVGVPGVEAMVTQGASEAIYQAMAAILSPGDQTIVADPGWPHIANYARMLGSEVVEVPIYSANSACKLLPDLVREHLGPRTKLITVIDPLNPLGSSYSEAEIAELCRIAEANDAYLLHDATYRDFALAGHYPAIRYSERAVMNVSLSKVCGFAGLRIGATLAHPALLARIAEHQVGRLGGNWLAQRGAIAAYRTKPRWLARVVETVRRNQDRLKAAIDGVSGLRAVVSPSSGNFLAVDVADSGLDAEAVTRGALEAGFVIRSGAYTSARFGDRFVRITLTLPEADVERFCDMLPGIVDRLHGSA